MNHESGPVMNSNDEWQQLAATWQAQPVDLPKLRTATRWKTLRMWLVSGSEVAALLWLYGLCLFWLPDKPRGVSIFLWCWALLCTVFWWLSMRHRRGTWRPKNDSVHALLELKLARARAGRKLARWSFWIAWFSILVSFAVAAFLLGVDKPLTWTQRYGPATISSLILMLWALAAHVYQRQRERELRDLQQLLQDLDRSAQE